MGIRRITNILGKIQRVHVKHFKEWSKYRVYDRVSRSYKRKLYRNMVVRTYYAMETTDKTPVSDIADFRIERITYKPLGVKEREEMDKRLDRIEWVMSSIFHAKRAGKIAMEVSGLEVNVLIDPDEGKAGSSDEQVSFKGSKFVYDTAAIAEIESQRGIKYKKYKDKKRSAGHEFGVVS